MSISTELDKGKFAAGPANPLETSVVLSAFKNTSNVPSEAQVTEITKELPDVAFGEAIQPCAVELEKSKSSAPNPEI